jgi:hypothetical protein
LIEVAANKKEATELRVNVPLGKVEVATMTWLHLTVKIYVTNDHEYVPLVVNTSWSSPHSRLIPRFVTIFTRLVPLVE